MSEFIARHLSGLLRKLDPKGGPELDAAVAAVFRGIEEGHVCLDRSIEPAIEGLIPELRKMSQVVGGPGEFRPLIIDDGRLYLARYWRYEEAVAKDLRRLSAASLKIRDPAELAENVRKLFAAPDPHQEAAVRGAAGNALAIISGGPGTGKTATVAKILAVRLMLASEPLVIRLAAPTGKAADRLRGSVSAAKLDLPVSDAVKQGIPEEASTLHRLLEMRGGVPRRNRENPLRVDLLVIDEASMIDLSLMAKVLDALPERAGLILLGDRDQLDAVQPGSIFGEICRTDEKGVLSGDIFPLVKSYRFGSTSGIGLLAKAVNSGDEAAAVDVLRDDPSGEITWIDTDRPEENSRFSAEVRSWLSPYFERVRVGASPADCFEAFNRCRVLTPLREGLVNVGMMNERIAEHLRRDGVDVADWYRGRPVLVNVNSYGLRLFNGDVGLVLPDEGGKVGVVFPGEGGSWRRFAPARLPSHEPAYAFTVHKSQGSEFETVLLLIPPVENPVISRNLLYTGITRAKKRCLIWGSEKSLREAVRRKPLRGSGLWERLV